MATKKELNIPTAALSGASARAKKAAHRIAQEEQKKGQKKSNSDYIRLDMRPDGIDLKEYCITQAANESKKAGRTVTMTKYIQNLIKKDMDNNEGGKKNDRRKELAEMLDKVSDKDLSALEVVIKALCK